jgi:serine protease Do
VFDARFAGEFAAMTASIAMILNAFRPTAVAGMTVAALMLPVLAGPAQARGPEKIADVAETVIDAVVNISTSQRV